jgi:hypothetical protein
MGRRQWLPARHDCCFAATVLEHLTVIAAGSCVRRFLATPLYEIIAFAGSGHGAREGEGEKS